jgi:hypothetical protein
MSTDADKDQNPSEYVIATGHEASESVTATGHEEADVTMSNDAAFALASMFINAKKVLNMGVTAAVNTVNNIDTVSTEAIGGDHPTCSNALDVETPSGSNLDISE